MPPKPVVDAPVPTEEEITVVDRFDGKWISMDENQYTDVSGCDDDDLSTRLGDLISIDGKAGNLRLQILIEFLFHIVM